MPTPIANMLTVPGNIGLYAGVAAIAALLVYRALLPKPIPGIPYDKKSAASIFGNAPEAMKHHAETHEIMSFLRMKCKQLESPIIQVFMRPFGGSPWVVMTDGREAQDIMTRRGREFDRSRIFADMLISLYPNTHILMKTNDQWRWNRRLIADAMSPDFVNNVAPHMVYEQTQILIDLWRQKARLCQGHTTDVLTDITRCTVDAIFAATFGVGIGANKAQTDFLAGVDHIDLPDTEDELAEVPPGDLPESWDAFLRVFKSSEIAVSSPLGRTAHWFAVNFNPTLRKAIKVRERIVMQQVKQAYETFGRHDGAVDEDKVRCIVDLLIAKEAKLAQREGRSLGQESKYLLDELSGFIVAGFDTTAATLSWGFKYLTERQDVQLKVREELRNAFPGSNDARNQLSAIDITRTKLPYLDAFSEEVLRHCGVVPANIRETMQDSIVLGHLIPKGTDLYMLTNGPGMMEPAMPIDEEKRSSGSQDSKADHGGWGEAYDISEFKPERWLKVDENGSSQFDPRAAPQQAFGGGLRGCFGKKLAYCEMRLIYAMILWSFELRPIPSALRDSRATDILTHAPRSVNVSLAEIGQDLET